MQTTASSPSTSPLGEAPKESVTLTYGATWLLRSFSWPLRSATFGRVIASAVNVQRLLRCNSDHKRHPVRRPRNSFHCISLPSPSLCLCSPCNKHKTALHNPGRIRNAQPLSEPGPRLLFRTRKTLAESLSLHTEEHPSLVPACTVTVLAFHAHRGAHV